MSEIDELRKEIERLRAREEWFVTYIINKKPFLCPMPEGMCDQQYGRICCLNSSETERRKQCWRKAVDIETSKGENHE